MKRISNLRRLFGDKRGISSVEYALLLAFVGGGIIAAAAGLSLAITNEMENTAACISGGDPSAEICS